MVRKTYKKGVKYTMYKKCLIMKKGKHDYEVEISINGTTLILENMESVKECKLRIDDIMKTNL